VGRRWRWTRCERGGSNHMIEDVQYIGFFFECLYKMGEGCTFLFITLSSGEQLLFHVKFLPTRVLRWCRTTCHTAWQKRDAVSKASPHILELHTHRGFPPNNSCAQWPANLSVSPSRYISCLYFFSISGSRTRSSTRGTLRFSAQPET